MSNEGYLREIAELQDRLKALSKKCWGYERDYIAPCFTIAAECGIDLEALVRERVGDNCVDILIRELIDQRDAARSKLTKALPDHQALIAFLREAFRNDGAEGESVHAACDIIERLSENADDWERRATAARAFIDHIEGVAWPSREHERLEMGVALGSIRSVLMPSLGPLSEMLLRIALLNDQARKEFAAAPPASPAGGRAHESR